MEPPVPRRPCPSREAVAILWDQGLTAQAIADEIQVQPKSVFYHLRILQRSQDPRAHRRPQWTAQKRNQAAIRQDW